MLDVNNVIYQHLTQIEKMKNLLRCLLSWDLIEKERKKEGKNISKQICVRRDGALRGAASAHFLPLPKYS